MSEIESVLSEIKDVYVRLKPSPIAGIGVFAIRDIPKGCRDMFTRDSGEWIKVPKAEVEKLPSYTREMVETYCTFDLDSYYIERTGFKKMDLCCYVNHSDTPNIAPVNNGEYFEALVDIKKGEELTIDYGTVATE